MWRFTTLAATLVFAFLTAGSAARAAAQAPGPQIGIAASATVPSGDFHADAAGDGYDVGWQAMALVSLRAPRSRVGFRFEGGYGQNASNARLNADLSAASGFPSSSEVKFLGGMADLTYTFWSPTPIKPYVLGGLGAYRVTVAVTVNGATADTSGTEFAWNVGGGFTYNVRGAGLFFEVRYVDVAAVPGFPRTPFLPITLGLRL